jgi:hypothetical protein
LSFINLIAKLLASIDPATACLQVSGIVQDLIVSPNPASLPLIPTVMLSGFDSAIE